MNFVFNLVKTHRKKLLLGFVILFLIYWFSLPTPIFNDPTCMVLEDKEGNLLGARIASDGQWRFPPNSEVPGKFAKAILEFEDKRFYRHPGIDPISLLRALKQDISKRRIVSGGSTISMQVMRMALKAKSRNIFQKVWEMMLSTRLEIKFSKEEILALYASNAPFGGNVVGLDAAAWRYFGKSPKLLSWAEASTLAVLPNSPSLIHPGKNRKALLSKRNRLLKRLLKRGVLDSVSFELAKEEPLPDKPHPLPRLAPHLLERAYSEHFRKKKKPVTKLKTCLEVDLQRQVTKVLQRSNGLLKSNGIHNLAALVIEVESGNVLAYVGNVVGTGKEHGEEVDVIKAARSTGSILKPLLYALMLQEGNILPNSLISDIPTQLNGYRPKNFYESYDGLVPAKKAVIRSLNVPFVRMLQRYGLEKFHFELQKLGFYSINHPPDYYGLTLILGGAEASLWEIANAYACMARTLNHFYPYDGKYDQRDFRPLNYVFGNKTPATPKANLLTEPPRIAASAAYLAFDAMQNLERPNSEGEWQRFQSSHRIAWKTGTSFGFRDAWAVGITRRFVVGVWAGNADGEGRPGLIGVLAAAPALFDIFDLLPASPWFEKPIDEMCQIEVCRKSGYRALPICPKDSIWAPLSGKNASPCPFHRLVHLDKSKRWQVNSKCELPSNMIHVPFFVLPPVEEYYYKSKNPNFKSLPPFREDCFSDNAVPSSQVMQLIYPKNSTKIYVPVDLDGNLSRTVFKLAHRNPEIRVFWHLDGEFLGTTTSFHNFELNPSPGKHLLTLVDENGNRLEKWFEILAKGK